MRKIIDRFVIIESILCKKSKIFLSIFFFALQDINFVNSFFASYKLLNDFLQESDAMDMEDKDLAFYFSIVDLLFEAIFVEKKKEDSNLEIKKRLGKMLKIGKLEKKE